MANERVKKWRRSRTICITDVSNIKDDELGGYVVRKG
jgi:hypothetical protein